MDMIANLFIQLFRALFAFIDFIIYGVISIVYNLFIQISDTGIFGNDVFQRFSTRIYSIIGIVMLFKLAFSLITYIVNPDEFSSKDKGMGKLITNIMVTLVLIVITPTIFREAFNLQRIIIKENVIGQLILGDVLRQSETDGKVDDGWYQQVGDEMSFTIASAFVTPTMSECKNINWDDESARQPCIDAITGKNGDQAFIKAFTSEDRKASYLFDLGLINAMNDGVFLVDYTMLISTIAGGLTAWIFFIFCIDIATRSVKLAFMQLIAPVPIISYIDPKSGKSGIFSKWVKECLKTFADLFVRILAIYFCIFVISELTRSPMFILSSCDETMNNCTTQTNPFVLVFIILGVLMFAGKLPKLIEDMFGVKMGGFTLNPMKKLGQSPIAAAAIGGLVGGIGGFAGNVAANNAARRKIGDKNPEDYTDAERQAMSRGRTVLSGIGGLAGGAKRGIIGGAASGGKGSAFKVGTDAMTGAGNARNLRSTGYGTTDKIRDRFTNYAGIKNDSGTSSELGDKVKQASQRVEDSKAVERRIEQMKAALSQKARSDAAIGEFNRVAHFDYEKDPTDPSKIIRKYDFDPTSIYTTTTDASGNSIEKLDDAKVASLYAQYSADATSRGMSDAQRLSQTEFIEAMDLERQGWEQDKATKKLEKALKGAQEDESLAKPKKS